MPAKPPSAQERFERRQARRQVKKVGCLCSLCLFWNVSRVEDGLEMLGIAVYTRAFVILLQLRRGRSIGVGPRLGGKEGGTSVILQLTLHYLHVPYCSAGGRFLSDSRCSKHARVC